MIDVSTGLSDFEHEVRISDYIGNGDDKEFSLTNTYEALIWLGSREYKNSIDYDVNMWGDYKPYVSFYFKDMQIAIAFSLTMNK
jgi:hypothetical protein